MTQPSDADEAAARAAAEAIEHLKQRCSDALERIRVEATAGQAAQVEAGVKALHETMRDPKLPREFVQHISAELKGLDLTVHMKATDMALRRAVAHAQADRKAERNQEIALARGFLSRAMALGANDDFKHAADMTIESAMLTGGVKQTGNGHREAGTAALDIFSEWKAVYIDYSGKLQKAQIDTHDR